MASYPDVDGTKKAWDFQCRSRSYNEHDGVNFAIRNLAVMAQGVPVVASAPGPDPLGDVFASKLVVSFCS